MKRWTGSLLIAAVSSLVTLLLAWSTQPNRPDAPAAAVDSAGGSVSAPARESADDVLLQLAILGGNEMDGGHDDAALSQASGNLRLGTAGSSSPVQPASPRVNPNDGTRDTSITATLSSVDIPGTAGPVGGTGAAVSSGLIARCVEVAHDIDAGLGRRIAQIQEKNPAEFERSMRFGGRKLLALAELKERDPDLYGAKLSEMKISLAVRMKARELCQSRLAGGNHAETESLDNQLRSMLGIQLAMSIKARGETVCRLQEQVNNIKSEIDHQASAFNETVDSRYHGLTGTPCGGGNAQAAATTPKP